MAGNSLLTVDMITSEAVRLFKNSNLFIMNIDTQYDPAFAVDGAKIGSTLRIRLPNDYIVTSGPALQLQNTTEQYTTLTVNNQYNVAVPFTSAERTMSIDNYSEIIMAPMINNLAGAVAQAVMNGAEAGVCNFISNVDGNGNIISPTSQQFVRAGAILDNNSADPMTRRVVDSPDTDANMSVSLQGLLNPATKISAQYEAGAMKSGLGFGKWFRDQTVIVHTSGTYDNNSKSTVNGADQTGQAITVTALGGTLVAGDFVTFDGVYAVNRVTKATQAKLRQFVILTAAAAGATSVSIYPALTPAVGGSTVQYQTVTASPANGANMTSATKSGEIYYKNLAYVQKAVTLATADLVMPTGAVVECARANYDGISMRVLTDYLNGSDQLATRVDVLFGWQYIRPEWLCVIADQVG
jgi:hypothetical protein